MKEQQTERKGLYVPFHHSRSIYVGPNRYVLWTKVSVVEGYPKKFTFDLSSYKPNKNFQVKSVRVNNHIVTNDLVESIKDGTLSPFCVSDQDTVYVEWQFSAAFFPGGFMHGLEVIDETEQE